MFRKKGVFVVVVGGGIFNKYNCYHFGESKFIIYSFITNGLVPLSFTLQSDSSGCLINYVRAKVHDGSWANLGVIFC